MNKIFLLSFLLCLLAPVGLNADPWVIDSAHSNINFKISHFTLSRVTGSFGSFNGTIQFDPEKPEEASVNVTVQIASINTGNAKRDDHLNKDDFFDSSGFPIASFKSTSWTPAGEGSYRVEGELTLLGKTLPVTLDTTLVGVVETPRGISSGWEASTTIDRYDWGVGEENGASIGRQVDLEINVAAIKQS